MYTKQSKLHADAARLFFRAIREAAKTGGYVAAVETTDHEIVPATKNGHTSFIAVYDARTPINHPGEYPKVWDASREDSPVRSIADAENLLHAVTAQIA